MTFSPLVIQKAQFLQVLHAQEQSKDPALHQAFHQKIPKDLENVYLYRNVL